MPTTLPPRYEPRQIEARTYQFWTGRAAFRATPSAPGQAYVVVIPPPNVTSQLHMGHALNSTVQDVLVRFRRMQGRNTLWLPGTDHAGIATQNVVERELARESLTRQGIGRRAFLQRAWQWKERYGGRIIDQLKRLGCSCDWDRLRFTMDEGLSRAVSETFVRLHEKGLVYRGKYIVNWCPRCRTALSDIETEHEEHQGHLWYIDYPLTDGPQARVTVATTRPETMLGDTAVAVHANDPRYAHLIGRTCILPVVEREIPVIADEWVDPSFGTGTVKVTPAHDPNDWTIAKRHELAAIVVIDEDGRMTTAAGDRYAGMDRFECREALVEDLRARGALPKIEPYTHSVGHCYRCHTVVEPYLSDQWYVRMRPLADKAIAAARDGRLRFHPERWTDLYLSWLENVRDWCVSRQIWWGHRVPVHYCDACGEPAVARRRPQRCPNCGGAELHQDPDVLDTWFSSALWPFSTLGWPDDTEDLHRYYPTDTLVTGRDIIYFWVARMVMMGLEFMGDVPFRDVYIHGNILDEVGRKMSKSLGNGIDPIELIDEYGADAVRFCLIMLSPEGQDLKLSRSRFEMGRNFANKLWNAGRFALISLQHTGRQTPGEDHFEDRWIRSRLQATIETATANLEAFRDHEAARSLYDFLWHDLCDWYLEIIKPRLAHGANGARARETLALALDAALRLLHPYMPFVTEEIWQHLKLAVSHARLDAARTLTADALVSAQWPEGDPAWRDAEVEDDMALLQDIVRAVRNLRKEKGLPQRAPVPLTISCPDEQYDAVIGRHAGLLQQVAALASVDHRVNARKPPQCATTVVGTLEIFLPLEGLIDVEDERHRLGRLRADVERQIDSVDAVLHKADFLAKAPPEIVQQKMDRAEALRAKLTKIIQNLADLQ
jgi:valyl-tRNA synthetase